MGKKKDDDAGDGGGAVVGLTLLLGFAGLIAGML